MSTLSVVVTRTRTRDHALVTVDLVILTVREERLQVLLVERANEPFRGQLALPGGFLRDDEDLPDAALRELGEETGLDGARLHLEQLRTYGMPGRDPRDRVITIAYLAMAPDLPMPVAGSDAAAAHWEPAYEVLAVPDRLAFDHREILTDGVERACAQLERTTLATVFCGKTFTIGELRAVYEAVWGMPLDPRNFARKVKTDGFVEPAGVKADGAKGRPAKLYQAGEVKVLKAPMFRPSSTA